MTQHNDRQDNLNKITHSPSYRLAYEDIDFLNSPRLRAARMELEFLKPDFALDDHGIENTIVVFGSTRIVEPAEARRRLEEAQRLSGPTARRCRAPTGRGPGRTARGQELLLRHCPRVRPAGLPERLRRRASRTSR